MKAGSLMLLWVFGWTATSLALSGCDTLLRVSARSLELSHGSTISLSYSIPW